MFLPNDFPGNWALVYHKKRPRENKQTNRQTKKYPCPLQIHIFGCTVNGKKTQRSTGLHRWKVNIDVKKKTKYAHTEREFIKWMWRKDFKARSVHCHRFKLRDVKPASTNISNSLSAALPTLFVRFTSAIRLSVSQRTHGTLSCCAALIETANSLSQAKWAGRNRGGGKNLTKHIIKGWKQRDSVMWFKVFSDSHKLCFSCEHLTCFFFPSFVICFVQNVPRWTDSSLQSAESCFYLQLGQQENCMWLTLILWCC